MPAFSALVLLSLPLVALAAPHDFRRHSSPQQNASLEARTTYTLKDHYTGNDFLYCIITPLSFYFSDFTAGTGTFSPQATPLTGTSTISPSLRRPPRVLPMFSQTAPPSSPSTVNPN
jgi:hypothetical protein